MNKDSGLTEHERFEELCALSASGELTPEETAELDQHLDICTACRETLASYREFVPTGMAYLASQLAEPIAVNEGAPVIADLEQDVDAAVHSKTKADGLRMPPFVAQPKWIALGAVAVLLVALMTVGAYRKGRQTGRSEQAVAFNQSLSDQLQSVIRERDQIYRDSELRSKRIDDLTTKVKEQTADLARLRDIDRDRQAQYKSLAATDQAKSSQLASLSTERNQLATKLRQTEESLADLNKELVSLKEDRQSDLLRAASFEAQVRDLSARLKEEDLTVETQQKFLGSDRDIRELMGARQLYIADVFDVSSDSRTRKPYGRVFYTRGKSLIFYAFDLDHQPGIKNASTFQVWGENESAQARPVKLGVLYIDNEENRRWALRCDDPKQLAQIDAVFVTIEPNAHSNKPTGSPFLYASLRKEPNHP